MHEANDLKDVEALLRRKIRRMEESGDLPLDEQFQNSLYEAFAKGETNFKNAKRHTWPIWFVWAASAAVLLVVLFPWNRALENTKNIPESDGKTHIKPENPKPHMLVPDVDPSKWRYVGILGETGILEYQKGNDTRQTQVKPGDILEETKIIAVQAKYIEIKTPKGQILYLRLKGTATEDKPEDPVVVEQPKPLPKRVSLPFVIEGTVSDESGKPVSEAEIHAFTDSGSGIKDLFVRRPENKMVHWSDHCTAISDAQGRFRFTSAWRVAKIQTTISNVILEIDGAWEKKATVNLTLVGKKLFLLEGNLKVENLKQRGNMTIYAYGKDKNLLGTTSTQNAGFKLKTSAPIHTLSISAFGLLYIRKGEWEEERQSVDIDFKDLFTLDVLFKNSITGKVPNYLNAHFEEKDICSRNHATLTHSGIGTFSLQSNMPVLKIGSDLLNVDLTGPWNGDNQLEFDLEKLGYYLLKGTLIDDKGEKFPSKPRLLYYDTKKNCIGFSYPDGKGEFSFLTNQTIGHIEVRNSTEKELATVNGPWKNTQDIIRITVPLEK